MIRLLCVVHRYLGIAIGALMSVWCLSGLVMMYVSYPALGRPDRLAHLAPMVWRDCCRIGAQQLGDTDPAGSLRIEMLAGRPVLALGEAGESAGLIDLTRGVPVERVSSSEAASVAARYAADSVLGARSPRLLGLIGYDEWTVAGDFDPDRPLYHFALGDGGRTELYVSSTTGRAVQLTTGRERFWNWLGSVPHWLYFARLRHHPGAWIQVIIWTSLLGCFLAAIGLTIGVQQLPYRPAGRWSAYRGWHLWHHLTGLAFGVFALTWVLSGLLSVNPWGLLQGTGGDAEQARLSGAGPSAAEVRAALQALAAAAPADEVSIASAPLDGRLYWIAATADGRRERLDWRGVPAPLGPADLQYIGRVLNAPASTAQLLERGDGYYFSHHDAAVELPVYRLALQDGSATRYYIDPVSGALLAKIDRADQGYRWWHDGLHRLDFTAVIRGRPQWDLLMWLLLSGVTTVCVIGTYLGYRRLTR